MALVNADRVKETSNTNGTGTLNLAGAATGFQTFVAGIGNGNTCWYCITDNTDWEVGVGTVTSGSPDTLSRDTVFASSQGVSKVNWAGGTSKDVFNMPPAKFATQSTMQVFTGSGTWTKPSGCRTVIAFGVAGGGAGGGAEAGAGGSVGAGGGAGSFALEVIDVTAITSVTVTVGGGGTANSGAAGGNGGATSFGAHFTCNGGVGGTTMTNGTSIAVIGGAIGGAISTGGNINIEGGDSGAGLRFGATGIMSGIGGSSYYGGAPRSRGGTSNTSSPGEAGTVHGSGGGGAYNHNDSVRAGGAGAGGRIDVIELY